jgi:hypothetical protein
MDHHIVAGVSIAGSCLDVLGSLYLAYDLLGGQHGPLRLLTRAVTYSIVFAIGYGLGLGLFFGVASGAATGITVAIEFNRASRNEDHHSLFWEGVFSAIRGAAFGAGLYRIAGFRFALAFGVVITLGQVFAYSRGMRPALDYSASRRPRFSPKLLCNAVVEHVEHPWLLALRVGLVTGIVTTVGLIVSPFIEYFADHLPARRLGAFGIALIFVGFSLQSFQYWLAVLDVPVH